VGEGGHFGAVIDEEVLRESRPLTVEIVNHLQQDNSLIPKNPITTRSRSFQTATLPLIIVKNLALTVTANACTLQHFQGSKCPLAHDCGRKWLQLLERMAVADSDSE